MRQNEEMNDIIKTVKSLEESGLLIKCVNETIKNEAKKKKKESCISQYFIRYIRCWLFGYLLTGKVTFRAGEGTIRAGGGTIRVGKEF